MNDQRKVIFDQRLEILNEVDLSEIIREMRYEILFDVLDESIPEKTFVDDWDIDKLDKDIKRIFSLQLPIKDWCNKDGVDADNIRDQLIKEVDEEYTKKSLEFGEDLLQNLEKTIVLQSIDQNWKDHLGQLENLRQIVGLRGYAQRDPLNEYKSESFSLFEELLTNFREDVTRILFHIRMASDEGLNKISKESSLDHMALKEDISLEPSKKKIDRTVRLKNKNEPINPKDQSTWGKVGRNVQCPCGSGKKYKNCHG